MTQTEAGESDKRLSLTAKIMIAMGAGLIVGVALNMLQIPILNEHLVEGFFGMIGTMFVNALKMLVVPLVAFSLICGVAGIGDISALGRVGGRSLALYIFTTFVAIVLAICLALIIGPGQGFVLEGIDTSGVSAAEAPSAWEVFANIIPGNPIAAFANGDMLQVIFYVIIVGIAAVMLGEQSKSFIAACEYMNELMMKIVNIVMAAAPYGVFCLIAKTFAEQGLHLFGPVLGYVITLVSALFIHLFVVLMAILAITTRLSPRMFLQKMRNVQIFAFSTATSSGTIPVTYRTVTERLGVDPSVASFTVPFGATINMDGTAIMQGVATVFLVNVYGVELGLGGYATVIGMAVLASIGTAGVPGVGMVMLTMVLGQVGLPIEGIAIVLGVDRLMDMIRTAVNVTGDAVVSVVVAKAEDKIDVDVFNDPDAGAIDDESFEIDHEAEQKLSEIAHKHVG
ncbi:MAG: dicarboxylate/amino acid:cation symporter [Mangrovicoccus sp.]|nr:dicarboxylate/amino acid:cation symporter [Mangrovicoccus sp.]